ncbi:hypothetical protein FJO69_01650 [[Mycoplasma] falconis]|uniref:Uncharacterized protein n=1 Tax=[Mycoplasma] falconis TaxID=92403 RepID=A0A501XA07_9BACT|nr:hypothetical protein [[Mycoplasma] falconis]TPE57438.1 hypothetical protein FJO69_01650 [[Mycoplasma] falconis]
MQNETVKPKSLFPFKSNDKKRLATFWVGVTILIILFSTFVASWPSTASDMYNNINNLKPETIKDLINKGVFPSISGGLLQVRFTFTYITNILAGVSLITYAAMPKHLWTKRMLFLSNVYISITFIVFWSVIIPFVFTTPHFWSFLKANAAWIALTIPVHFLNPLIAIIMFIINRKNLVVSHRTMLYSFLMMISYWLFALLLFVSGIRVAELFLNQATPEQQSNITGIDSIYLQTQVIIYPFLNFSHPMGYAGDNVAIKTIINILIPISGSLLCIGLAYFWKGVCHIKIYNKKDLLKPEFKSNNKPLFDK